MRTTKKPYEPSDADDHPWMIKDCIKREDKLDARDREFIHSIRRHVEMGGALSSGQIQWLDDIWERVT